VAVDEELVAARVEELLPTEGVAEEGVREAIERAQLGLKALTADVDDDPLTARLVAVVRVVADEGLRGGHFYLDRTPAGLHATLHLTAKSCGVY